VLLTVERVAVLRHVDLFAATPDRVLAGVAQVVEEVDVPGGRVVMTEGEVENWLFVVVDGEVDVIRSVCRSLSDSSVHCCSCTPHWTSTSAVWWS
jgi:hypothetical protein